MPHTSWSSPEPGELLTDHAEDLPLYAREVAGPGGDTDPAQPYEHRLEVARRRWESGICARAAACTRITRAPSAPLL
jgi:hypothetical protein